MLTHETLAIAAQGLSVDAWFSVQLPLPPGREDVAEPLLAMRVAKEVKAFKSFAGYPHAVEQVGTVARQNEGWFMHTRDLAHAKA